MKYLVVTTNLLTGFKSIKIYQMGRDLNSHADALAGLALVSKGEIRRTIAVDLISAPFIYNRNRIFVIVSFYI